MHSKVTDICLFQAAFDDIALFFYDVYGGNYVGVVWKPSAAESENQIKVWTDADAFDLSQSKCT